MFLNDFGDAWFQHVGGCPDIGDERRRHVGIILWYGI